MRYIGYVSAFVMAAMFAGQAGAQTLDGQLQHMQGQAAPAVPAEASAAPAAMIDSEGGGAIPALPLEAISQGGVTYITGGIGDEELAELKALEKNYNLHMLMTAPGGAFIGDVTVRVLDAQGKALLSVDDAGPYFYAKLAAGTYTLDLNSPSGGSKTVKVKIPAKGSVRELVAFKESAGITTAHKPTVTVDKP